MNNKPIPPNHAKSEKRNSHAIVPVSMDSEAVIGRCIHIRVNLRSNGQVRRKPTRAMGRIIYMK